MTAYTNDKGTRWGIGILSHDLLHQKTYWTIFRKKRGEGWWVIRYKTYEHSEAAAQAALDAQAKKKRWRKVEEKS